MGLGEQRGVEHDEDVQRHAHRGNRGNRLDRVLCDQRAEQADLGAARYNIDVIERKPCKGRQSAAAQPFACAARRHCGNGIGTEMEFNAHGEPALKTAVYECRARTPEASSPSSPSAASKPLAGSGTGVVNTLSITPASAELAV